MSRVLVTGASGFLGRRLGRALAAAGHEVVGSTRAAAPSPPGYRRLVAATLGDPATALVSVAAEAVVHGAWDPLLSEASASGTLAWAEALAAAGVARQLFLSTITASQEAASAYGREKHRVERWFLDRGHPVLRLGLVLGRGGMCGRLVDLVEGSPVVPLLGGGGHRTWWTDPELVDRVVAVWAGTPRGVEGGRPLALHQAEPVTLRELLAAIAAGRGLRRLFVPVPMALVRGLLRLAAALGRSSLGGISEINLQGLEQNHALSLPSDVAAWGGVARPLREALADLGPGPGRDPE